MAKNIKKVDESQIRAAIAAIRDRKYPDVVPASQHSQILNLRRKLGKRLLPLFAEAGLEIKKINKILAEHQRDVRSVLAKHKATTAKNVSALNKNMRLGLANRRKALEHIRFKPFLSTFIPLLEVSQIWATPAGMLTDTHIEPHNNWAKFAFIEGSDTFYSLAYVSFYFFWQNPSGYVAVVNVNTDLAAQGVIQANALPGLIEGGDSSLQLNARLRVFVGSEDIGQQNTQLLIVDSVSASGGTELLLPDGDLQSHPISGTMHHLSCSDILVESGQTALFEVTLEAVYHVDNGSITLDFNYADYSAMCPGLTLELLTAPTSVTALG